MVAVSSRPVDREAIDRVRALIDRLGLGGVVLTTPGSVAWATAGINTPIDRSAGTDTIWVAIGPSITALVTTNVEQPRLAVDLAFDQDCVLVSAPWWDAEALVTAAASALGADPASLASDGHPGFGRDASFALTVERLAMTARQQQSLTDLACESAHVVEAALAGWRPGQTDHAIAARIAEGVERFGGQCPVLLVGGDERVLRFRHPVAVGLPINRLAMAVLVASRGGQHVALTRFASAGRIDMTLADRMGVTREIQKDVVTSCVPGASVGAVMTTLADSYDRHGHGGAWRDHYQGGPIGYAQREFEIAPVQTAAPWWDVALPVGCAVAFNPSVAGGAKDEDTFLITDEGPRWITRTDSWPTTGDASFPRPAVLDIEN
jgi:Xaa-Pro dipeptidase